MGIRKEDRERQKKKGEHLEKKWGDGGVKSERSDKKGKIRVHTHTM